MKRILGSCTVLLLGLAATHTIASAQETPGLEGIWLAQTTVTNCQGTVLRHVRNLEMYIQTAQCQPPAVLYRAAQQLCLAPMPSEHGAICKHKLIFSLCGFGA
jgi:hypothetical protein